MALKRTINAPNAKKVLCSGHHFEGMTARCTRPTLLISVNFVKCSSHDENILNAMLIANILGNSVLIMQDSNDQFQTILANFGQFWPILANFGQFERFHTSFDNFRTILIKVCSRHVKPFKDPSLLHFLEFKCHYLNVR